MILEYDLEKIKKISKEKEQENIEFRSLVKQIDFHHNEFLKIAKSVYRQINCRECANCCRVLNPILDESDVVRISKCFKMGKNDFVRDYLKEEKSEQGKYRIAKKPCHFLKGNDCSIYSFKPRECRSYPHLLKKEPITYRMLRFLDNAAICPIVFNTLELYKEHIYETYEEKYVYGFE